MKKILIVLCIVVCMTGVTMAEEQTKDLNLINLSQDEGGSISISGDLTDRESAIWDLMELNFIMTILDIEDIFELDTSIHQFRDLSDEGVVELEKIIRKYVLRWMGYEN